MKPGPYVSIGKQARDLLNKDFNYDQKFSISTTTASGITFNTSGTKKGEAFATDVVTNIVTNGLKTEIKVDSKSALVGSFAFDTPVNGLKWSLGGNLSDLKSGKVDATYVQEHANLTASSTLNSTPVLQGSLAVGVDSFTVGGEVGYDTASSAPTKYNFGIGFVKNDFSAALIVADKMDTFKASYFQSLGRDYAMAVEVARKTSKNEIIFTAGGSCKLDPLTVSKVRLNNLGTISGLIQHEWRPKSFLTVCGEVDSKDLNKSAKVGFAVQLKP